MSSILIVDDIDYVRKNISTALENEGYDILEASNGDEAMKIIRESDIDLLIIDVLMPKKNGMETLLEHKDELARLKKIIITGEHAKTRESFLTLAKYLDVLHILYKPFKKKELIDSVRNLLAASQ